MAKTISSMITASLGFASAQHFYQQAHPQVQDLLAPIRRLQTMPITTECKTACPTLEASYTDMMSSMVPQTQGNSSTPDLSGIGEMMAGMCKHKTSFECMAANQAACSGMGDMGGLDDTLGQLECLCTACPCMMHAYGSLMELMMKAALGGASGEEMDPTAMMLAMCPMVEPLECIGKHSSCSTMNTQMGSMANSTAMIKSMCTSQNKATRPAACAETSPSSVDSAFPQLAAGLVCLMPTAAALLDFIA